MEIKTFNHKKEETIKFLIMGILIATSILSIYFFHLIFHTSILFTHFFYIPIILACVWWKRKGIFVALILSVNLLFSHFFYRWHLVDIQDILRSIMFLIVAILVAELKEKNEEVEENVKLAYEKINQIFCTIGNGLRVIDKNFNMIQFNDHFLDLLGITKKDAIGKKCYEVFRGPLCHTPDCSLRRIFEGEERVECDIEKENYLGQKIFCILTATPLQSSKGELIGIVEDIRDITDRKHAEEALRESEARYRSFAKNFKGILYQSNINFAPVFFHGTVESITGYTEENFISGNPRWDQIVHHDDLPKVYDISKKLQKIPHYSVEREYRIKHKNGQIRWVEEMIQNICDEFGKPILIQGIIYDITERKETELALLNNEKRFLQSQKMDAIGRMAGGVAHDFNNLLTVITGNCDLLLDELNKNDSRRNDIEEIYKAGEHATSLTRQLLAISRRQMLQPKILDINIIVSQTEMMLRRIIGEDIELMVILYPAFGYIKADPGQIIQIIINLAANARDAMPKGGKLTIKTENILLDEEGCKAIPESRPGRFICLSAEDTGIGMDKEILSQIFEPFFTTKGPGEGSGLGLSTVYGIIKQHEGFIIVYSEPGQGSVFKIYLPVFSGDHGDESEDSVPLKESHIRSEKIL